MKRAILLFIFSFLIIYTFSCSESTSSKDTTANFALKLKHPLSKVSDNHLQFTDVGGTTFTITSARANVRHIQFDHAEGSSDTTEQISIDGPFIFDLVSGESNPVLPSFDLEPGVYKRIDVRLDDTKSEDGLLSATDDLMDNTFIVNGTFDYDGNANRNFTFVLKFNEDIRFETAAGFIVEEGEENNLVLSLNVSEWLQNVDITDCLDNGNVTLEQNGDLIINDENSNGVCSDFEQNIKTNLKNNYDFD